MFKWDASKWNEFSGSMGDWTHGDDFEASVAFLVANDAFGMLKEEMLWLAGWDGRFVTPGKRVGENLLEKYGFCNQIHDSLFFHCDYLLRDEAIERVLGVMREPCLTLSDPEVAPGGLFVDADVKAGVDWANMEGIKGV